VSLLLGIYGFLVISFAATLFLSVVGIVTAARQLATVVTAMGATPFEILLNAVYEQKEKKFQQQRQVQQEQSGNFLLRHPLQEQEQQQQADQQEQSNKSKKPCLRGTTLEAMLQALSTQIANISQQFLSFPMKFTYFASVSDESVIVRIVSLDELLTIIEYAVEEDCKIDRLTLITVRKAITHFMTSVMNLHLHIPRAVPKGPFLSREQYMMLKEEGGVPLKADYDYVMQCMQQNKELGTRRRILKGMVNAASYEWKDVYKGTMQEKQQDALQFSLPLQRQLLFEKIMNNCH